jgi:hypothetical protein
MTIAKEAVVGVSCILAIASPRLLSATNIGEFAGETVNASGLSAGQLLFMASATLPTTKSRAARRIRTRIALDRAIRAGDFSIIQ